MLSDSCSLRVHDVFEVPVTNEILAKDNGKSILNGEDKIEKVVYFQEEAMKLYEKSEIRMGEETLLNHKDKQVFLPRDNILIDCHVALDLPAADVVGVQGSSQLPNITTEITEGESDDINRQSEIKVKSERRRSSPEFDLPNASTTEFLLTLFVVMLSSCSSTFEHHHRLAPPKPLATMHQPSPAPPVPQTTNNHHLYQYHRPPTTTVSEKKKEYIFRTIIAIKHNSRRHQPPPAPLVMLMSSGREQRQWCPNYRHNGVDYGR
ncbi:hypothetical protein Tco_0881841 [Tanacetum coccineum]